MYEWPINSWGWILFKKWAYLAGIVSKMSKEKLMLFKYLCCLVKVYSSLSLDHTSHSKKNSYLASVYQVLCQMLCSQGKKLWFCQVAHFYGGIQTLKSLLSSLISKERECVEDALHSRKRAPCLSWNISGRGRVVGFLQKRGTFEQNLQWWAGTEEKGRTTAWHRNCAIGS